MLVLFSAHRFPRFRMNRMLSTSGCMTGPTKLFAMSLPGPGSPSYGEKYNKGSQRVRDVLSFLAFLWALFSSSPSCYALRTLPRRCVCIAIGVEDCIWKHWNTRIHINLRLGRLEQNFTAGPFFPCSNWLTAIHSFIGRSYEMHRRKDSNVNNARRKTANPNLREHE